jgi:hypothetical protein
VAARLILSYFGRAMISVESGADPALSSGEPAQVIHLPAWPKIWHAAGVTDMPAAASMD